MLSVFMAGPDLVRWELTNVAGHVGHYRLTIHHAHGEIVEYFSDVTTALIRQAELEELLVAARSGGGRSDTSWVEVPLAAKGR